MTQFDNGGTIDFHVTVLGNTTSVQVVATDPRGGVTEAYGQARCRPDDHFVSEIGANIAAGRALQELGKQLEEKGCADSQTEAQYERSQLVVAIEDIVDLFSDTMARLARRIQDAR